MTITTLFYGLRRKTNNRMQHVLLSIIFYHDYHPSHLLPIMETTKTKVTQTVKQIQIHQTSTGKLFILNHWQSQWHLLEHLLSTLSLHFYLCWCIYASQESVVLNCIWVQVGCMKEWLTIKHNLWGLNIINLSV